MIKYTRVLISSCTFRMPMSSQVTLLKDFLYAVDPAYVDPRLHNDLDLSELSGHALFAIFLYHRWILRAYVNLILNGKTKQVLEPPPEEISEAEAEKSTIILRKIADDSLTLLAPSHSCFALPTEESEPQHSWEEGKTLEGKAVTSDIHMDLSFYLVIFFCTISLLAIVMY